MKRNPAPPPAVARRQTPSLTRRRQLIARLYPQGVPLRLIAETCGCPLPTLHGTIAAMIRDGVLSHNSQRAGPKSRRGEDGLTEQERRVVVGLGEGKTQAEVAREMGVSAARVHQLAVAGRRVVRKRTRITKAG